MNGEADVKIGEKTAEDYGAVFAEIPPKNAVFGRVLLEMLQEKGVSLNFSSTAFFIMGKKNYLYYILHQKDIPAPKTVSVATEKAARNIEKELKGPLIARRLENLEETEKKKLETVEQIQGFAEGSEYDEDIVLFHEYDDGDKYRCLVAGDQIISARDSSEGWKFQEDNMKYSNLSDSQEEIVKKTAEAIGTPTAEVFLRGEKVFDVNPNPDLELFSDIAGTKVYESVAEALKNEV